MKERSGIGTTLRNCQGVQREARKSRLHTFCKSGLRFIQRLLNCTYSLGLLD